MISMADGTYPMLHGRRRRVRVRWPRRSIGGSRLIALGILAVGLLGIAFVMLRPHARVDPRRAYADAARAIARGNYSAARNDAIAAVAAAPSSIAAHVMLARAYLLLGEGLPAEAELTRATDAGLPATRVRGARAQARLLQDDPDGALEEAGLAPQGDRLAMRVRARVLAAQGHPDQAQVLLDAVLAAAPQDVAALTDLGRIRYVAGDLGGAAQAAMRAARLGPRDPAALTLQGEIVRARYGLVAALPWFEAALQLDAYHYPALIDYAATLGDAGRYTDMLAATRKAQAARPGSAQPLFLQAVLAARAGQARLARSLLQHANRIDDALPGTLLLGGGLDYADGRLEQAIGSWRRLVATQPMNVAARRLLGAALLRSHDAQGALDVLRPMAMRDDADRYTLTLVARALEATGDRDAAARFLDRAGMAGPGSSRVFAIDGALGTFAADAASAPHDPSYAVGLIRAQLDTGATDAAVATARALAGASPGAPAAQLALGDALVGANRNGDAIDPYLRAADLAFDEPTMLRLVDALGRAGRARDAAATLALYLQQNPQSIAGQRLRAHWLVATGRGEDAIEPLEAIRGMIGNRDAALLTDLALAYAAAGDGAIARRYGKAAYALSPMNAAVVDAYGLASAADGRRGDARQLFVKARALDPRNATIAAHLRQVGR